MMFLRKTKRSAALALCAALALAGRSYAADVIGERVPEGALVVVKFNNMAATSGKVAKLAEQLGLNMLVSELNDPLASLKQQLKITGGLKDDGDLAMVYLDPAKSAGGQADPNKSLLFLVPTTDFKTLTANLEGATTEGNVVSAKGNDGQTFYLADWNGYAAVSPTKALVAGAPGKGLKLPPRAAKETTDNDVALYANFAALRGPLTKQIQDGRAKAKSEMTDKLKAENKVPEKYQAALGMLPEQFFNAVEAFVRDADAATVGLTLTDAGVKQNVVAEFKQGSYLANSVDAFKNVDRPLLNSLPLGKYLMFGGFNNTPGALSKLIDDTVGPVVAKLPKDDATAQQVPAYLADVKQMLANVTEQSFGAVAPEGPVGQSALIQPIGSVKGDADKVIATMKDATQKYASLVNELTADAGNGAGVKQTYTAGGKTVDGVTFDTLSTEVDGDSPQANQQRQAMQFMYGAPKFDMFLGAAGGKVLSFANGIDDAFVGQLVANAKADKSPLADVEAVKAVAGQLPKQRFAEAYVGVDEIVRLGIRSAKQFGFFKGDVELPPDLQPVGLSLSGQNGSLEYTAYISNDLLHALVTAGMQVAAQMQGGGRGAQGGGL